MKLFFIISILVLSGCLQVKTPSREPISASVRELLERLDFFAGRTVLTTGYWNAGFELSSFSDLNGSAATSIWVDSIEPEQNQSEQTKAAINELLRKANSSPYPQMQTGRLWIRCEGSFEHSGTPSLGHLDAYSSRLTITRILEVRAVRPD